MFNGEQHFSIYSQLIQSEDALCGTEMGKRVSSFILNVLEVAWCKFVSTNFLLFSIIIIFPVVFFSSYPTFGQSVEKSKRTKEKSFDFPCSLFVRSHRCLPDRIVLGLAHSYKLHRTHTYSHARNTNNQSIKIVSVTYNAAFILYGSRQWNGTRTQRRRHAFAISRI